MNPPDGTVIDLETRHAPELEKPYVRALLGHASGDQLSKLKRLSGVVSKLDGKPLACGTIDGLLKLDRLARLECQTSFRNRNVHQPRGYFAS
jgi:hypothetical protein